MVLQVGHPLWRPQPCKIRGRHLVFIVGIEEPGRNFHLNEIHPIHFLEVGFLTGRQLLNVPISLAVEHVISLIGEDPRR